MLNNKISKLINQQVNKEMYSAYLYLEFANFYYDQGLDGFANWFDIQAKEEMDHAMLMRQYLLNNGERVYLEKIEKPEASLDNLNDPLKASLEHELYVTELINTIYGTANSINDYRTMQFFDWFVKEQGEEEMNSEDLIRKYELFGKDPKGLYALNQELAGRVYTEPSLVL